MMQNKIPRILITTPDYPPQKGGLATFSCNLEQALLRIFDLSKDAVRPWQVLVWNKWWHMPRPQQQQFDYVFHIQAWSQMRALQVGGAKQIAFFHGSELTFHSPNFFWNQLKRLLKKFFFKKIASNTYNIFISQFTQDFITRQGFQADFARDVIFHNAIQCQGHELAKLDWPQENESFKFICVARDVPHKNLAGVLSFCQYWCEISGRQVTLYMTKNMLSTSPGVEVVSIAGISNEKRDKLYQECHFNLLLSLDHSRQGFFEGFGLSCLEAASFGTPSIVSSSGGLPENVHDGINGFVLPELSISQVEKVFKRLDANNYTELRGRTFSHTSENHSVDIWADFLKALLK